MKNIIFRQTHVRMGLKPHATYGEKDAKAPSDGIDAKLVETFFLILSIRDSLLIMY
jgi:hypothetical protein